MFENKRYWAISSEASKYCWETRYEERSTTNFYKCRV